MENESLRQQLAAQQVLPNNQTSVPVDYEKALDDYLMAAPPKERRSLKPKLKGFIAQLRQQPLLQHEVESEAVTPR